MNNAHNILQTPLLPMPAGCVVGTLQERVKRFSVRCTVNGQEVWAHTNNSGSMLGLVRPGSAVVLSPAANPARKLAWTLELIGLPGGQKPLWVGVNTQTPNKLLKAAFYAGQLPWAAGYTRFTAEAPCGESRIDGLLQGEGLPDLWVECKNVTLVEDGVAAFPDAVSTRAQKHVGTMMGRVAAGQRAAFFYCIQRGDAGCFAPAGYVDPDYARLFLQSHKAGVEVYPHVVQAEPAGIGLGPMLPLAPLAYVDV